MSSSSRILVHSIGFSLVVITIETYFNTRPKLKRRGQATHDFPNKNIKPCQKNISKIINSAGRMSKGILSAYSIPKEGAKFGVFSVDLEGDEL